MTGRAVKAEAIEASLYELPKIKPAAVHADPCQLHLLLAAFEKSTQCSGTQLDELCSSTGLGKKWVSSWFIRQRGKASKYSRKKRGKSIKAEESIVGLTTDNVNLVPLRRDRRQRPIKPKLESSTSHIPPSHQDSLPPSSPPRSSPSLVSNTTLDSDPLLSDAFDTQFGSHLLDGYNLSSPSPFLLQYRSPTPRKPHAAASDEHIVTQACSPIHIHHDNLDDRLSARPPMLSEDLMNLISVDPGHNPHRTNVTSKPPSAADPPPSNYSDFWLRFACAHLLHPELEPLDFVSSGNLSSTLRYPSLEPTPLESKSPLPQPFLENPLRSLSFVMPLRHGTESPRQASLPTPPQNFYYSQPLSQPFETQTHTWKSSGCANIPQRHWRTLLMQEEEEEEDPTQSGNDPEVLTAVRRSQNLLNEFLENVYTADGYIPVVQADPLAGRYAKTHFDDTVLAEALRLLNPNNLPTDTFQIAMNLTYLWRIGFRWNQ
ncbi:hypothetical protein JAAARDRAFT_203718 [Jaapia argillacea MUCL 33604]|uniref:Homeobox domain-containing protein n=1 Tax=Jaapia argillacea MUCL 33604 TaxID=933084 RepID=A0A067QJ27_9AGAM|nr:hypothetical protein JAAARDRAFT_203718 [Jaapia argillacea MUCL 33604]